MCDKKEMVQSTVHPWVILKSSLDWDCKLSSLKDKVDEGFKFSYCWRVSKSAWKLTRDQWCPSSLRWSTRSCLGISNCSQCNSTWKHILVSRYPCWENFKLLCSIRPRKSNYLCWWLKEKSCVAWGELAWETENKLVHHLQGVSSACCGGYPC